jgi:hypothetical protein
MQEDWKAAEAVINTYFKRENNKYNLNIKVVYFCYFKHNYREREDIEPYDYRNTNTVDTATATI